MQKNNHNIHVKNYEHFNKAFKNWDTPQGKYIGNKSDYEKALKEEGMVSTKEADRLGLNKAPKRKEYKISRDALDLIESVKATVGKDGKVHPGDRAIEKLRNQFKYNPEALPEEYRERR